MSTLLSYAFKRGFLPLILFLLFLFFLLFLLPTPLSQQPE